MHAKKLFKKWPSVSTAAALLLGLQRAEAIPADVMKNEELKTSDPLEPLILKPAKTKIIPEHLFAGHRSHSSHSSHSSGSSGRGRSYYSAPRPTYVPPAPLYVPPATPRPTHPAAPLYAVPSIAPRATPTPNPVTAPATRIELTNGAVIYGTVLTKSPAGITIKGVDQKNYKIPRLILAPSTITALALPAAE
ncbi:MAG TPA: hypothetical protein VM940_00390 [Chthoniobacterales bacterium]|jgi:hypothetical protein|nr:hypothetical protein [Chthoniobacterales bacterium]